MQKLPICRICLVENVRMFEVTDKNLHELYKKLTDIPFVTADTRPVCACFFCYAKLTQCFQLMRKCLEAEELFARNEPNVFTNRCKLDNFNGLIKTQTENISIVDVGQIESISIKEELPAVCERLDDIIEPKEERQSDDEGLENLEDTPNHQFETDSEDDVLLAEFKIEAEEERISRADRRASDSKRTPVVRKKKLKANLEDKIKKEQRKNKQSRSKVVPNAQNRKAKPPADNGISNTALERNLRSNSNKYDITRKISNNHDDINEHRRVCVKEKRFKCNLCQRDFRLMSHLKWHMNTHIDKKHLKCDLCQRDYVNKCDFDMHMRTHTGEKPYKCKFCLRGFSQKFSLTKHIICIHTSENYKCDICQQSFKRMDYLTNHIRTHTDEDVFKCEVCHRCFDRKSYLKNHIRTHTGEKPFKCDICQRSFRYKCNLDKHIFTHTKEKPYACEVCQHSFSRSDHLTQHLKTHVRDKPHKCGVCEYSSRDKGILRVHIIRKHAGRQN